MTARPTFILPSVNALRKIWLFSELPHSEMGEVYADESTRVSCGTDKVCVPVQARNRINYVEPSKLPNSDCLDS